MIVRILETLKSRINVYVEVVVVVMVKAVGQQAIELRGTPQFED